MRLFLGLFPTDSEAEATARVQHAAAWPGGARLTPRADLHVTLHFLGEVEASRLDALTHVADLAAPPLEIVLDRFSVWHGGIAVLEPSVVPAPLAELHARLGESLRGAGFATDTRAYRPHATLARHAQGASLAADPPPQRWTATRYALVQSAGGRYLALRHWALQPA